MELSNKIFLLSKEPKGTELSKYSFPVVFRIMSGDGSCYDVTYNNAGVRSELRNTTEFTSHHKELLSYLESQITELAKKEELEGLINEEQLTNILNNLNFGEDVVTKHYVDDLVNSIISELNIYVTEETTNNKISVALNSLIDEAPETFNTLKKLSNKIIEETVKTNELIEIVNNKADINYVDSKIETIQIPRTDHLVESDELLITLNQYEKIDDNNNKLNDKANKNDLEALRRTLSGEYEKIDSNNTKLSQKADITALDGLEEMVSSTFARKEELDSKIDKETLEETYAKIDYVDLKSNTIINVNGNFNGIKIATGKVLVSGGIGFFNIDFSSIGFTQPPSLVFTAYSKNDASDTTTNNANWASIVKGSVTKDGARGRAKSADSAGLLAAMVAVNASDNTEISFQAIGF